jgi:hypothetical protein
VWGGGGVPQGWEVKPRSTGHPGPGRQPNGPLVRPPSLSKGQMSRRHLPRMLCSTDALSRATLGGGTDHTLHNSRSFRRASRMQMQGGLVRTLVPSPAWKFSPGVTEPPGVLVQTEKSKEPSDPCPALLAATLKSDNREQWTRLSTAPGAMDWAVPA